MTDPYAAYGKEAIARAVRPAKLLGPIKTRAEARIAYSDIVAEIQLCDDVDTLNLFLASIKRELLQFHAELDFFWEGDGEEFPGLENEIAEKRAHFASASDGRHGASHF